MCMTTAKGTIKRTVSTTWTGMRMAASTGFGEPMTTTTETRMTMARLRVREPRRVESARSRMGKAQGAGYGDAKAHGDRKGDGEAHGDRKGDGEAHGG